MKTLLLILGIILYSAIFLYTSDYEYNKRIECRETIDVLKQTIKVKEMTNRTLNEMLRKRDSIIFIQDSIIVNLKNHIH